jgi:DMSO reductase anchor subunit
VLLTEAYWDFIEHHPAASTPESATRLGQLGRVRFLDPPHSEENYLIKEMGFRLGRKHATRLRGIARFLGFTVPLLATALAFFVPITADPATVMAALSVAAGIVVERWLFFAEARHTVQLYYGAQQV